MNTLSEFIEKLTEIEKENRILYEKMRNILHKFNPLINEGIIQLLLVVSKIC